MTHLQQFEAIPSEADSRNSLRGDPSQSQEGHCVSVLEGEVLTFCALRRMRFAVCDMYKLGPVQHDRTRACRAFMCMFAYHWSRDLV